MHIALQHIVPLPLKERMQSRFSDVWLRSVELESNNYYSVTAASGSGKTTFVHHLYGIRKDYEGDIFFNGKNLNSFDADETALLRRNDLSIVFQDLRLFGEINAWENIEIKRTLHNTIRTETVEEWMQELGISDKKTAITSTLSYGEQQRLAIIRALVQPFQFLLMDEPFSHLDQQNKHKAAELILKVAQKNNAGLLMVELDENHYFPYLQKWTL